MKPNQSAKILIVDDDAVDRESYKRTVLEALGEKTEFLEAQTVDEASQIVRTENPDCIILDFLLPGRDGLSFLKEIKSACQNHDVPVIIVTGEGSENVATQAIKCGATDYVVKNTSLDRVLAQAVKKALMSGNSLDLRPSEVIEKLSVLIVDDDEVDREVCQRALKEVFGDKLTAFYAHSASDFFEKLKHHSPDCVLLDYGLPDKNGLEILRELSTYKDLVPPIVVVTGQGDENIATEVLKAGALDYVPKNKEMPHQVGRAIQYALDKAYFQREVLRKTKELEKANHDLKKALEFKSTFLSNISHEIRTPLNVIMGMADELAEDLPPEDRKDRAALLQKAGGSLLELINDVLDLSKIESGDFVIEKVNTHFRSFLENSVQLFSVRAREKDINLSHYVDPEVQSVISGDPTRLRQVILNLVGNALKFTDKGEIIVQVKPDPSYPKDSGQLLFSVQDTGVGIAKESREKIFDAFTQADSSTTRKYGGSGLGLSITKNLVELMGGKIWLESEISKGSTFYFSLPLKGEFQTKVGAKPSLSGYEFLLVDSNEHESINISKDLEKHGVKVETAHSASEAIQKVKNKEPPRTLRAHHLARKCA
jgi:signal transduction histidine kinase